MHNSLPSEDEVAKWRAPRNQITDIAQTANEVSRQSDQSRLGSTSSARPQMGNLSN